MQQSRFLLWCSRICRASVAETADVAYAYGIGVVTDAMGSDFGRFASVGYCSVEVHDVMIADTDEASLPVPVINIGNGEVPAFLRCRAVDNDLFYASHREFIIHNS